MKLTLIDLPNELRTRIFEPLEGRDLARATTACKTLKSTVEGVIAQRDKDLTDLLGKTEVAFLGAQPKPLKDALQATLAPLQKGRAIARGVPHLDSTCEREVLRLALPMFTPEAGLSPVEMIASLREHVDEALSLTPTNRQAVQHIYTWAAQVCEDKRLETLRTDVQNQGALRELAIAGNKYRSRANYDVAPRGLFSEDESRSRARLSFGE